jgi:hypothetical protein
VVLYIYVLCGPNPPALLQSKPKDLFHGHAYRPFSRPPKINDEIIASLAVEHSFTKIYGYFLLNMAKRNIYYYERFVTVHGQPRCKPYIPLTLPIPGPGIVSPLLRFISTLASFEIEFIPCF